MNQQCVEKLLFSEKKIPVAIKKMCNRKSEYGIKKVTNNWAGCGNWLIKLGSAYSSTPGIQITLDVSFIEILCKSNEDATGS